MMILTLRFMHCLTAQEFVVSDEEAQALLEAFEYAKSPQRPFSDSPMVDIVDEAEPLPPFEPERENQRDFRRLYGRPGSRAKVDLSAVASMRVGPVPDPLTER